MDSWGTIQPYCTFYLSSPIHFELIFPWYIPLCMTPHWPYHSIIEKEAISIIRHLYFSQNYNICAWSREACLPSFEVAFTCNVVSNNVDLVSQANRFGLLSKFSVPDTWRITIGLSLVMTSNLDLFLLQIKSKSKQSWCVLEGDVHKEPLNVHVLLKVWTSLVYPFIFSLSLGLIFINFLLTENL